MTHEMWKFAKVAVGSATFDEFANSFSQADQFNQSGWPVQQFNSSTSSTLSSTVQPVQHSVQQFKRKTIRAKLRLTSHVF